MGGISILMILAMMGAVTLAIIIAITLFIAATIISKNSERLSRFP